MALMGLLFNRRLTTAKCSNDKVGVNGITEECALW